MTAHGPGAPSEAQLDLAEGVRARAEGETTADPAAQVLADLKRKCEAPGGVGRVATVHKTCVVPLDVMQECRRKRRPFPDPHRWKETDLVKFPGWLECTQCHEWIRKESFDHE